MGKVARKVARFRFWNEEQIRMKPLPALVTRPGFEPRQAESESAVLPLYYRASKTQM